jgi:dTDP-4-amino-4,6-dideoxygalactose transaminase
MQRKNWIMKEVKQTKNEQPFLVFGAPSIEQEEIDSVIAVLESGWLGTGPRVAQFEKEFAEYKGVTQAAAVSSCTAALHLSLLAAGIRPGDEVITTALTFCSTVNAIIYTGGTPVLADIDLKSMNIDPIEIEKRLSHKTKAILPVHFAGRPCQMDAIMAIAREHDLKVIEDCAHAIETEYHGQGAGSIGDFGCFSFYVTKNVMTGEGGMVIARSEDDLARIRIKSLHGMSKDAWKRYGGEGFKHYQVVECGYKYNMMDLQAAIGLPQLRRVKKNWEKRQRIWNQYQQAFNDLPIGRPADPEPNSRHGYHLYTILVDKKLTGISRDEFLNEMNSKRIGTGVHYLSIPEHPYYQNQFGWKAEDYPNALKIGRQTVSLPLSAKMEPGEVSDVIEAVKEVLNN